MRAPMADLGQRFDQWVRGGLSEDGNEPI
jgi:hypothetical protein